MDEILIDEKKYISSKQAAKITGYAKDYIGQLCREGRVPARLVGRSWYVLEAAIQDHRFGTPEPKEVPRGNASVRGTASWSDEPPHYEAGSVEILPTIKNKPQNAPIELAENEKDVQGQESLQNSWREWFDRVGEHINSRIGPKEEVEPDTIGRGDESPELVKESVSQIAEDTEVNVPIRPIYQAPPRELLPMSYQRTNEQAEEAKIPVERASKKRKVGKKIKYRNTLVLAGLLLGIIALSIAILNTGYFDNLAYGSAFLGKVSGLTVYTK